jgi:site-specific DNA-methyltransferase (cytosine-N4-specific)
MKEEVQLLCQKLDESFSDTFQATPDLNRKLVSYQSSKIQRQYRWYKYKEAFSTGLVNYLLTQYEKGFKGKVIDPFAGSGTTLFASSELGCDAIGIELLPIGTEIIRTRFKLQNDFQTEEFDRLLFWKNNHPWIKSLNRFPVPALRITEGAYPGVTQSLLERYLAHLATEKSPGVQQVLRFALLCVLESISYTRKDGQYLRWDCRAERKRGSKKFQKKTILSFNQAITQKLEEILEDIVDYRDREVSYDNLPKCCKKAPAIIFDLAVR